MLSKRITKKKPKSEGPTRNMVLSNFRLYFERTSKQRISNVVKNTFFRNLKKCSYHIIQSISQLQTKKHCNYNVT